MRMEYPKGLRAALLAFGFDEKEATLYLAGLEIGSGGVLELARRTGLARTTIYPIVEQLRRRGFFRRKTIKGHPHYVAEPPHALLERFEERQRAFAEILPDLQMLHASARDAVGVTVYEGSEGFKQFWRNVIASGVREYCLLTSGKNMLEYVHQPYLVDRIIGNRVKAGIKSRQLLPDTPRSREIVAEDPGQLRESRFLPPAVPLPATMLIYGNDVAFVTTRKENAVIMVTSGDVAVTLRTTFEMLWSVAKLPESNNAPGRLAERVT